MKLMRKKQQKPARRSLHVSGEGRAAPEDLAQRYAFRRNRTLTGSLSSDVVSATEQRAELRSARMQAHDLRKHRRKLSSILFIVLLIAAGLGYLIFESIALPNVEIKGLAGVETSTYEQKIQQYLGTRFLQRSRLTLDTDNLARFLQANGAPEVESVSPDLSFAGLGKTTISLTMRRPAVNWRSGSTQLFVDTHGIAFAKNFYDTPGVEVVDETGIQAQNNRVLASNRFLGFIGRIVGRLEDQGYTVTKVVLPASTTRQLQLSLQNVPYMVKVSVDRPAGAQAEDAARSIRYLSSRGMTPQYLDVRVEGRVFYQ